MKFGVNTFIWTANFDRSNLPLLPQLKAGGFDGVEVPLFRPSEVRTCSRFERSTTRRRRSRRRFTHAGSRCDAGGVHGRWASAVHWPMRKMTNSAGRSGATAGLIVGGALAAKVSQPPVSADRHTSAGLE